MAKKGLAVPDDEGTAEDIAYYKSIEHVNVRGSNAIHGIDYTDRGTCVIYMVDGSRLEYEIPRATFDAFQKAESKGKFFNAEIRNTYAKVN